MKNLRLLSLSLLALPCSHVISAPVLARVLGTSGSVSGAANGGGGITKGASIGAGSNNTGSDSQISFTPFPGSVVTYAADTRASIERIDLERASDTVVRSATFRLAEGTLFFAVDKVNWKTTTFAVLIPEGKVTAQAPELPKTATAGVVVVRDGKHHVVTEAGNLSFTGPNGAAIEVGRGSVLSSNGASFAVVNLTSGQVVTYNSAGAVLGVHTATPAELQVSSGIYASATDLSESLIASGTVDGKVAEVIGQTLLEINQKLVAQGAQPVNNRSVRALPVANVGSLPALSGAPGAGAANPANVFGQVNSREN